jgi:hypothetical protein
MSRSNQQLMACAPPAASVPPIKTARTAVRRGCPCAAGIMTAIAVASRRSTMRSFSSEM